MTTIAQEAPGSVKPRSERRKKVLRGKPEPSIIVNIRLGQKVNTAAKVGAAQRNITKRQLFEDALRAYLQMEKDNA